MYHSDKLILITQAYTQDTLGNQIAHETERSVWADILSAGQREFFAAAQQSLKPERVADISAEEYCGETAARFEGVRYTIYRTYTKKDRMELYLTTKGGATNDAHNNRRSG